MKKMICALALGLLVVGCAPRRTHVVVRETPNGKVTRVVHRHGPRCGHIFRNGGWVVVTKRER